jgi:hypothetical protein
LSTQCRACSVSSILAGYVVNLRAGEAHVIELSVREMRKLKDSAAVPPVVSDFRKKKSYHHKRLRLFPIQVSSYIKVCCDVTAHGRSGTPYPNSTHLMYRFTFVYPCGYFFAASSSDIDGAMITGSPGIQFTGVDTL